MRRPPPSPDRFVAAAAITGQLAGALYGASDIPVNWVSQVAWGDQIKAKAARLIRKATEKV